MNRPPVLLLTGFGPFPGIPRNPSATLVKALSRDPRLLRAGISARPALIATTYAAADATIPALVQEVQPDAVLMFGVASRRRHLSVEAQARNRLSLLHPDAAGKRPARLVLAPDRPAALPARAPLRQIVTEGQRAGHATRLSRTAGAYLCNYSYWLMLDCLPDDTPCLFLHIPKLRGRAHLGRLVLAGLRSGLLLIRQSQAARSSRP